MKETKLIVVCGMSGCGKSTTAQHISYLYAQNGINHEWYHEEMADHPIRWANGGEFNVGDINTEQGMELNIADTYSRWQALTEEMCSKGGVYIMEGCLFQNIIRYFIPGNYPNEKIKGYYDRLFQILEPANPHVIHLYRPDVARSFKSAFKVRGKQWEKIITEGKPDFGFQDETAYQTLAREIFMSYQGKKLGIDTSEDNWDEYYKRICAFLGIKFFKRQYAAISNPELYAGEYEYQNNGEKETVRVICEDNELYCSPPWWKYIKMNPIGENEFELSSFPLIFKYSFLQDSTLLSVSGNYDWGIAGKTFERV